jgi:hypothetical protein
MGPSIKALTLTDYLFLLSIFFSMAQQRLVGQNLHDLTQTHHTRYNFSGQVTGLTQIST